MRITLKGYFSVLCKALHKTDFQTAFNLGEADGRSCVCNAGCSGRNGRSFQSKLGLLCGKLLAMRYSRCVLI
jgi:hypothetical protein